MHLIVGLGNPGSKYEGNRHNIGFMAVDEIVRRHGFSPWRKRFQGETSEGLLGGEKVLRPQAPDLHERKRPLGGRGHALLRHRSVAGHRASMTNSTSSPARCG